MNCHYFCHKEVAWSSKVEGWKKGFCPKINIKFWQERIDFLWTKEDLTPPVDFDVCYCTLLAGIYVIFSFENWLKFGHFLFEEWHAIRGALKIVILKNSNNTLSNFWSWFTFF